MQKVWKRIAVLVSVFCLALTAAIFCACGEKAEEAAYTVKVVLPDGDETPVEGVELTFCDETDETKTLKPVKTDADGKAVINCKKADYRVKITDGIPSGYALFNAGSDAYCTKTWGSKLSCVITLDKAETDYTVTVAKLGGSAVANVEVVFTPETDAAAQVKRTTDANGTVNISLPANINYLVTLNTDTLPNGFAMQPVDLNGISTANGDSITFTLSAGQNYSFQITGAEGAPLEGITVTYAPTVNGSRTPWGVTDENGKLSVVKTATTGYTFITAPDGYVYNEDYGTKCPYVLKKGTITFGLLKLTELIPAQAMSPSEQEAFAIATNGNPVNSSFLNLMSEAGRTAYSFDAAIAEGETQAFSFTPAEAGNYSLFVNFTNCEIQSYDSLNLRYELSSLPSKSMYMDLECEANTTYYYTVAADKAQTLQLVIVTPEEKNNYTAEGEGNYEITIKDNLPAMLSFRPAVSGEYTLTIKNGECGYRIDRISQATLDPIFGAGSDIGTVVFTVLSSELFDSAGNPSSNRWIFRFTSAAENPAYPLGITVKFEKTGEVIEKQNVVDYAEVRETLTQYGDQTGTLKAVGVTGAQVVKGSDGYYRYGNANGPVVVVKLQGEISPFYNGAETDFSTLDKEGSNWYTFFVRTDETTNYFVNYAQFLRGYTAYSADPTIEVEEYYLKYVNKDGVYPLNDELKTFLEYVVKHNKDWLMLCGGPDAQQECLWLFSAFYYDNGETTASLSDAALPAWKKED